MTKTRNLEYRVVGDCLLLVHSLDAAEEEEWRSFLDFWSKHAGDVRRLVASSQGPGPSSRIRRELAHQLARHGEIPIALLLSLIHI